MKTLMMNTRDAKYYFNIKAKFKKKHIVQKISYTQKVLSTWTELLFLRTNKLNFNWF